MASRTVLPVAAVGGLAALSMAGPAANVAATSASTAARVSSVHPIPDVTGPMVKTTQFPAPQTIAQCQADFGINCYTPVQYRVAYDLNRLYSGAATGRAITGAGETIVIVDAFGSPTIENDLRTFDAQFGFPNPDLQIDQFGSIPPFDPTNATRSAGPRRPASTWSTRTPSRPAQRSSSPRPRSRKKKARPASRR